jgi:hypothetical protein
MLTLHARVRKSQTFAESHHSVNGKLTSSSIGVDGFVNVDLCLGRRACYRAAVGGSNPLTGAPHVSRDLVKREPSSFVAWLLLREHAHATERHCGDTDSRT